MACGKLDSQVSRPLDVSAQAVWRHCVFISLCQGHGHTGLPLYWHWVGEGSERFCGLENLTSVSTEGSKWVNFGWTIPFRKYFLLDLHFPYVTTPTSSGCNVQFLRFPAYFLVLLQCFVHPWQGPDRPQQHSSLAWANSELLAIFNFPLDPQTLYSCSLSGNSLICCDAYEMVSEDLLPRVG